jgi:hypothetical protein
VTAVSYNQPKLCSNATWQTNANTFADSSITGIYPHSVFVNTKNEVYVAGQAINKIIVWTEGNNTPSRIISSISTAPDHVFVTPSGDIYVDRGGSSAEIARYAVSSTVGVPLMHACQECGGTFVDIANNLYCAITKMNQVVTQSLDSNRSTPIIVAGIGITGNTPYMLKDPYGIFVDVNFDLYVADCFNNRVQLFEPGQRTGRTVAGAQSVPSVSLNCPMQVVLDADNNMLIADYHNRRILLEGPTGFRCIAACTGVGGSAANQLIGAWTMSLDSYGNIFIADSYNHRIQKFDLLTNSCGEYDILLA